MKYFLNCFLSTFINSSIRSISYSYIIKNKMFKIRQSVTDGELNELKVDTGCKENLRMCWASSHLTLEYAYQIQALPSMSFILGT